MCLTTELFKGEVYNLFSIKILISQLNMKRELHINRIKYFKFSVNTGMLSTIKQFV